VPAPAQVSLVGSILSNCLLVLGCAFLLGGIKYSIQVRPLRKVPYYTASHTTPHTTLHLNKNREDLRQRKFHESRKIDAAHDIPTPGVSFVLHLAPCPSAWLRDCNRSTLATGCSGGGVLSEGGVRISRLVGATASVR
jgi:hypothetical protein